jgi:drug/metabolite transporter (DMT)-like permease/predicted GNAT family acetyltransferase
LSRSGPAPSTLVAFAFAVLIGGSNFVAVRLSNRELPPFFGAGSRFASATLLLFLIAAVARISLPRGRSLQGAVIFGMLNFFAAYALFYWGLQRVPAALAGVVFGAVPLFTFVLAVLQKLEHFAWRAALGALVAIGGIAVMAGSPANGDVPPLYVAAVLLSALAAAETSVVIKLFPAVHPVAMNAVGMAVATPLLLALSLISGERWVVPERSATWLAIAFLVLLGSVGLFILFVYVIQHWTASGASYQFVLIPIVAALGGWLVLGESLTASLAFGGILVIAGVYIGALARTANEPPERSTSLPERGLRLTRHDDIDDFEAHALDFLSAREAEHNLFLGICSQIRARQYRDPYLVTVEDGERIVAAAFRTPPFPLGLSQIDASGAVELIAEHAHETFGTLPGFHGPKVDAGIFAELWSRLSGQRAQLKMEQRIYEAAKVHAPEKVPGTFRPADENDRATLINFLEHFTADTGAPAMLSGDDWVDLRLAQDARAGVWLWEDGGRTVSMAGYSGPTPHGIRVNAVYTPPELRGRGYASACVAALTKMLLDTGRRFCFLYTDLSNPTSNSIYQRIGYRPISDVDEYQFDAPGSHEALT